MTRIIILALLLFLGLFGRDIHAQSNLTFLTADVVGLDSRKVPAAGTALILRIVVHNRTKENLKIDALRTMGKEQFVGKENDGEAFDHPNFLRGYVDQLKANFVLNGVTNFVDSIPFPFSGEVPAGGFVEVLCVVSTPRQSGLYQIDLEPIASAGTAVENFRARPRSIRHIRPSDLRGVRIRDFRLK